MTNLNEKSDKHNTVFIGYLFLFVELPCFIGGHYMEISYSFGRNPIVLSVHPRNHFVFEENPTVCFLRK